MLRSWSGAGRLLGHHPQAQSGRGGPDVAVQTEHAAIGKDIRDHEGTGEMDRVEASDRFLGKRLPCPGDDFSGDRQEAPVEGRGGETSVEA